MRGDRVVVQDGLCGIHQLLSGFDVTGVTGKRVHHPEFGQGQADRLIVPADRHAIDVDFQLSPCDSIFFGMRFLHCVETPEQGGNPRHQVWQADVFGQVIVRAEAEAGDRIEFRIPCGQENNRQVGCTTAKITA